MNGRSYLKTMVVALLSAAFILPTMAWSAEKGEKQEAVLETSKTTIGSEVINQEVIQILRKGEMAKVTMNIAGQPGVYYKVEYSETGLDKSYKVLPKGTGVIGGNGFGSMSFNLQELGKDEVYLQVTTSDTEDFAQPRVMPKPLVLLVEQVKVNPRGANETIGRTINQIKRKLNEKIPPKRNSAVCGVRG